MLWEQWRLRHDLVGWQLVGQSSLPQSGGAGKAATEVPQAMVFESIQKKAGPEIIGIALATVSSIDHGAAVGCVGVACQTARIRFLWIGEAPQTWSAEAAANYAFARPKEIREGHLIADCHCETASVTSRAAVGSVQLAASERATLCA